MNILVVGGKGFIGTAFVRYAQAQGHRTCVIGSDCDIFSSEGELFVRKKITECDAMVFLAAKRPFDKFDVNDYTYNVRLAERYIHVAYEVGLKNICLASSRSVYSGDNTPWKESYFESPLSLYGASKQAVDSIALLYNAKYGMNIKSLRLAQVIGLGEHKGYLLNTWMENALQKKKLTVYGKGKGKRQYIYLTDVCDAFLHCVDKCSDQGGVYNIGMPYNVSIIKLAEIINNIFGNDAGVETIQSLDEDKKVYMMDVSKAENELGWKASFDVESCMEDIKRRCDSL